MDDPRAILVAMPTWVGDAAMATPALEAVHERFPSARIDFLIKPYLNRMFDGTPWLGKSLSLSRAESFWSLRRQIAGEDYDLGLLLSNSFYPAFLMWAGGVKKRIGYRANGRSWLLTGALSAPARGGRVAPYRMIDYYGAIAETLGARNFLGPMKLYPTFADRAAAEDLFHSLGVDAGRRPVVAINPGAHYGSAKRWPDEYFAEVADALAGEYDAQILVLAGPGEDAIAQNVITRMKARGLALPSARVHLGVLKAVVERLHLMITNDTGPRHYAAAFGVPVVTILGSTHKEWGDTGFAKGVDVQIPVDCGPCMKRACPLGHHKCMRDLTPVMVISAARDLLTRFKPPLLS